MSQVPVIIAARNEAVSIGRTLESLPPQAEPIVIPNGCSDQTAEIAARYGATILPSEVEGKMTAIQTGISYLGKRALEPFVTLDADSRPFLSNQWLDALQRARASLDEREPAIATGGLIFTGGTSFVSSLYRTLRGFMVYRATKYDPNEGPSAGANMLIHPLRSSVLDEILDLPQIWPGEDASIKDVIVENGGGIVRSLDPRAMVFTDSDRYPGLLHRLIKGRNLSWDAISSSYLNEAPPCSITGAEYKQQRALGQLAVG